MGGIAALIVALSATPSLTAYNSSALDPDVGIDYTCASRMQVTLEKVMDGDDGVSRSHETYQQVRAQFAECMNGTRITPIPVTLKHVLTFNTPSRVFGSSSAKAALQMWSVGFSLLAQQLGRYHLLFEAFGNTIADSQRMGSSWSEQYPKIFEVFAENDEVIGDQVAGPSTLQWNTTEECGNFSGFTSKWVIAPRNTFRRLQGSVAYTKTKKRRTTSRFRSAQLIVRSEKRDNKTFPKVFTASWVPKYFRTSFVESLQVRSEHHQIIGHKYYRRPGEERDFVRSRLSVIVDPLVSDMHRLSKVNGTTSELAAHDIFEPINYTVTRTTLDDACSNSSVELCVVFTPTARACTPPSPGLWELVEDFFGDVVR